MINIIGFIFILQLFFILLFTKTFGQTNELPNEVKILIHWSQYPEMNFLYNMAEKNGYQSWNKNERFELRLYRLSYGMYQQFGKAVWPSIVSGKTGRYDFASLGIVPTQQQIGTQNVGSLGIVPTQQKIGTQNVESFGIVPPQQQIGTQNVESFGIVPPQQQIGTQNVESFGIVPPQQQIGTQNVGDMEEAKRRRKAKGKKKVVIGMEKSRLKKFELHIKLNSTLINQIVIKRLEKLPKQNEILICNFDASPDECKIINYNQNMILYPERRIFFQMNMQNDPEIFRLEGIECTKLKGISLDLKSYNYQPNGVEYFGPLCPFDEYTFYFLVKGQSSSHFQLSYNCDEAIYGEDAFHRNIYQLTNYPDGTLECKLLLIDEFDDAKNLPRLPQKIVEFQRQFHGMEQQIQQMFWQYFYKQIDTFQKKENLLEKVEKILSTKNLSEEKKTKYSNEIAKIKLLQAEQELMISKLVAIMENWQNFIMKIPSNSEITSSSSSPFVAKLMKELKESAKFSSKPSMHPKFNYSKENIEKGAFTSTVTNIPHLQHSYHAGTQQHLSASSNVLRGISDTNSQFLEKYYEAYRDPSPTNKDGNSSQSRMLPPKYLKRKNSTLTSVRISGSDDDPMTVERQSQPETNSMHHDYQSLNLGLHLGLPSVEDQSGGHHQNAPQTEQSTEPAAEGNQPKNMQNNVTQRYMNVLQSLQIPQQIFRQQISPHQKIGQKPGSAFKKYKGKEKVEASVTVQHQSSASTNLQQEEHNPVERGQHENIGQLLAQPFSAYLQSDKQKEQVDKQQSGHQKRGPNEMDRGDGKGKDEEGTSGQKSPKKAKKS